MSPERTASAILQTEVTNLLTSATFAGVATSTDTGIPAQFLKTSTTDVAVERSTAPSRLFPLAS